MSQHQKAFHVQQSVVEVYVDIGARYTKAIERRDHFPRFFAETHPVLADYLLGSATTCTHSDDDVAEAVRQTVAECTLNCGVSAPYSRVALVATPSQRSLEKFFPSGCVVHGQLVAFLAALSGPQPSNPSELSPPLSGTIIDIGYSSTRIVPVVSSATLDFAAVTVSSLSMRRVLDLLRFRQDQQAEGSNLPLGQRRAKMASGATLETIVENLGIILPPGTVEEATARLEASWATTHKETTFLCNSDVHEALTEAFFGGTSTIDEETLPRAFLRMIRKLPSSEVRSHALAHVVFSGGGAHIPNLPQRFCVDVADELRAEAVRMQHNSATECSAIGKRVQKNENWLASGEVRNGEHIYDPLKWLGQMQVYHPYVSPRTVAAGAPTSPKNLSAPGVEAGGEAAALGSGVLGRGLIPPVLLPIVGAAKVLARP